jgi:hypothetical protein
MAEELNLAISLEESRDNSGQAVSAPGEYGDKGGSSP